MDNRFHVKNPIGPNLSLINEQPHVPPVRTEKTKYYCTFTRQFISRQIIVHANGDTETVEDDMHVM
jgi:hypothetical protein